MVVYQRIRQPIGKIDQDFAVSFKVIFTSTVCVLADPFVFFGVLGKDFLGEFHGEKHVPLL